MNQHIELTYDSLNLFTDLARSAADWSGVPLFEGDAADRGNLTDLKKKGLLTTTQDSENKRCFWVYFTDAGFDYAAELGIDLSDWR